MILPLYKKPFKNNILNSLNCARYFSKRFIVYLNFKGYATRQCLNDSTWWPPPPHGDYVSCLDTSSLEVTVSFGNYY